MEVSRGDLSCVDFVIKALNKLRFDLNGVECMQFAGQLAAFGQLRSRIESEIKEAEEKDAVRIKRALDLLASSETSPPPNPPESDLKIVPKPKPKPKE